MCVCVCVFGAHVKWSPFSANSQCTVYKQRLDPSSSLVCVGNTRSGGYITRPISQPDLLSGNMADMGPPSPTLGRDPLVFFVNGNKVLLSIFQLIVVYGYAVLQYS